MFIQSVMQSFESFISCHVFGFSCGFTSVSLAYKEVGCARTGPRQQCCWKTSTKQERIWGAMAVNSKWRCHFREGSWGVTGDSSRHCCENGSIWHTVSYSIFLTPMYRCSRFGDIGRVADDVWNLDQIAIQCETRILILDLMPAVMCCFSIVRLHRSKRHLQIWGAWFATVDRYVCIVASFMWHIVS